MKKRLLMIIINLAVTFLLFMSGHSMTTKPGTSSGNGNPAILLFVPLAILFVVLVLQWVALFKNTKLSRVQIVILWLIIAGNFTIGISYQMISYRKYRFFLSRVHEEKFGVTDWPYIKSITSGLSIHINNQYFNVNTYLLFVSLSLSIWGLYRMVKSAVKRRIDL